MDIADDLVKAYNDGYKQGKAESVAHGKWIKDRGTVKCSECGFGMFPGGYYFMGGECISANDGNFRTKFCPNCGTEMEVGE